VERAFARMSPRGLPLIGSCDWNDGLSALGVDEKGESVWLGWFIAGLLRDWADIYTMIGQPAKAETCIARRKKLIADINAHAWDPAGYFRCATKDSGEWIGASSATEGKIHLNPQTWAILADGVDDERRALCWQAVQRHLLTPFGPLLLSPAYTVPDATVGYITRYSPGSRENGGVYMHAATWALLTACKLKQPELVEKIWHSIAPPTRGADAEAYWAEPYVLPGNVDGPTSERPGRAGWTWYTGSAAWLNKVSLEWMLGLRPTLRGLLIDPCPAPSLGRVQVSRVYRGKTLRVSFDAAQCREGLAPAVTINGQILPGNLLTDAIFATLGPVTDVGVTWGAPVLAEPKHESAKGATVGALRK
jgi:cellobiose phosphorylase